MREPVKKNALRGARLFREEKWKPSFRSLTKTLSLEGGEEEEVLKGDFECPSFRERVRIRLGHRPREREI